MDDVARLRPEVRAFTWQAFELGRDLGRLHAVRTVGAPEAAVLYAARVVDALATAADAVRQIRMLTHSVGEVREQASVARGYAGCFDVTPDWHPILDESPVRGLYLAVGFSGHGFKLSPAVGAMMARLITEGKSDTDEVHAFRLARFAEGRPIRGTYGDWLMC